MNLSFATLLGFGLMLFQTPVAGPNHQGITAGHKLSGNAPIYPEKAKREHVQGIVRLRVKIAEDGTMESAFAVEGPELLRQAAVDAVLTWVYSPFLRNGKPEEFETTVYVNFNLNGG